MRSFRECDIRGKYPDEIDEDLFFSIGNAIAARWESQGPLLVGRDVRWGSESLQSALMAGAVCAGGTVIDLGCVPTPVVSFARRLYAAPAAVAITASHNPPEYNGLKLLLANGSARKSEVIRLSKCVDQRPGRKAGGRQEIADVWPRYIEELEQRWKRWIGRDGGISIPSFVIDPGAGAWSKVAKAIFDQLQIPCSALHDEPDPAFRARSPDCTAPGSLTELGRAVREQGAGLGVAWDGDGDRFAAVDSGGGPLSADQMGLILARGMPVRDEKVLIDLKISRKVAAEIRRLGGLPIIGKSAHCALEQTMVDQDCLFGCEYSGHFFYRDMGGTDDGFYSALRLISMLAHGQVLGSLLSELPKFHITPDIRVQAGPGSFALLQAAILDSGFFKHASVLRLDGLRLDLPEGWFLLRQSVSEDKITFRAEGETHEGLVYVLNLFLNALPSTEERLKFAVEGWLHSLNSFDSRPAL